MAYLGEPEASLRAAGQIEDPGPKIGKRVKATIGTVRQAEIEG